MPKPSLREDLLDAGLSVMFRSGYNGSSVRDIAAAAGAPQGSFTNHFRSKEAFAGEVLERYFDHVKGLVREALDDSARWRRAHGCGATSTSSAAGSKMTAGAAAV